MSAIITEQFRILSAENFRAGIASTGSSYYTWIGLPNAPELDASWNTSPPAPIDSIDDENRYWDTMIAMKKSTLLISKELLKNIRGHLVKNMICIVMIIAEIIWHPYLNLRLFTAQNIT